MTTSTRGRRQAAPRPSRIGLALAGGGPLGGVYEIGTLVALSEALEGVDFSALDIYVGVSAGSFVAAGLANGISPERLHEMFVESDSDEEPFNPELLIKPAFGEFAKRAASVPSLVWAAAWHYFTHPWNPSFFESFQRLSRALPSGLFDNENVSRVMGRIFSAPGRSDDFRKLKHQLVLVATDLDTGHSVEFGTPGLDHVPISRAVQASAALPGLYPPVEIDGRHFVDGALRKTLHASVALKSGAELVFCVNPIVPFDSELAVKRGGRRHNLVKGGLPMVLSQTFRAMIHSRMQVGMGKYDSEFKGADVILFEPRQDDDELFFTNVFSYASRRHLCEHAYQQVRADLLRRRHELVPILARHGIRLRLEVLRDPLHTLLPEGRRQAERRHNVLNRTSRQLSGSLDELDAWLEYRRRQTA